MANKRKYARRGEFSLKHECTNRKWKWQGSDDEKLRRRLNEYQEEHVCPDCGNTEFYRLLSYSDA
jgi:hypothetical protein